MLRTALPQASRVVRPSSASSRIAGSASFSSTKWNWMFCRVVTWQKPREYFAATSAKTRACRLDDALRRLDAQHLDAVLTLAVGAARQPKAPPVVRGEFAALELVQQVDELVDVALVGKIQIGTPESPGVVNCGHTSPRPPWVPVGPRWLPPPLPATPPRLQSPAHRPDRQEAARGQISQRPRPRPGIRRGRRADDGRRGLRRPAIPAQLVDHARRRARPINTTTVAACGRIAPSVPSSASGV